MSCYIVNVLLGHLLQERYLALKENLSQPIEGSEPLQVDESEIYLEAVGGLKKQRVYGLGSDASSLYSNLSFTFGSSARAQQEALEQEVRELRETVALQQVLLQQQQEEMQRQMQQQMQLMQEEMMRKMREEFSSHNRA